LELSIKLFINPLIRIFLKPLIPNMQKLHIVTQTWRGKHIKLTLQIF